MSVDQDSLMMPAGPHSAWVPGQGLTWQFLSAKMQSTRVAAKRSWTFFCDNKFEKKGRDLPLPLLSNFTAPVSISRLPFSSNRRPEAINRQGLLTNRFHLIAMSTSARTAKSTAAALPNFLSSTTHDHLRSWRSPCVGCCSLVYRFLSAGDLKSQVVGSFQSESLATSIGWVIHILR